MFMQKEGYADVHIEGLSELEARERLKTEGLNIIVNSKKISATKIFLSQFNDFIIWVLIVATIISGFMGNKADAITILIIVFMNAILGFIQEYRTEKSLEALKKLSAPNAKVIRDGDVKIINAENLVINDIVLLEAGDRIPGDGYIIQSNNLLVDESLLTGESLGVEKDISKKNSKLYMGTTVLRGQCKFRITHTGMKTEMGKIANMLDSIENETSPLKEKLASMGKVLVVLCIIICVAVTILGIFRGQDPSEMFMLGVSLAVAAIPEGLAAIVTISLAIGVSRMLKRNALVRKLPAVETLGCTSIICSDKTGTLTENNMTVKEIYYNNRLYKEGFSNTNFAMLKKAFIFCNDCNYNSKEKDMDKALMGDPTEAALIKVFFNEPKLLDEFFKTGERIYSIPFDSTRKMMSVVIKESGVQRAYIKGAPEKIINRCRYILINGDKILLDNKRKADIFEHMDKMSKGALRCIGAAYKDDNIKLNYTVENNLVFLGFAGIIDPPRKEAKVSIAKCKSADIKVVMITGDHKNTAYAIGRELDICKNQKEVCTGEEIDKMSGDELKDRVKDLSIFARVSPEHKLKIVRAFKSNGNVVAMTGDGVNDAPAVKEADIGISMGISGTDVTKQASAMILLDDNFSTIVAAVEEGRGIYLNIRKFIRYLLSCNLGEVLTMFLSFMFYLPTPLLPIQILFINLATDGLPAIALGVDPPYKDVMLGSPRDKAESIFAKGLKEKIIIRGVLIGLCTILSFMVGRYFGMDLITCRTLALCTLVMSQLLHVFECRSEKHSIFKINVFSNLYLLLAVGVSISMLFAILYIPFLQGIFHTIALSFEEWLIVVFFSGIIFLINSVALLFKEKE